MIHWLATVKRYAQQQRPRSQIGLGQLLFRNCIPNRQVVKKTAESVIVVLQDTPANILKRITFYDSESRQIQKELTDRERI
jgi:hypothetical protein